MTNSLFIFGLGYTATRFALAMQAQGWNVAGTVRSADKAAALQAQGITAHVFDGDQPMRQPMAKLRHVSHVLSSIPPQMAETDDAADPVLRHHGRDLIKMRKLEWVGYLSSTGVYGDTQGQWVSESSPIGLGRRTARAEADLSWQVFSLAGLPVHIFRLPGIYGPGRNALTRARAGMLNRIDLPGHVFSRIHVDDIIATLQASIAQPEPGAIYNVADDEPASSADLGAYACQLLGIETPPLQSLDEAGLSPRARAFYSECRRVANDRIKEDLGVRLRYPTYREGLQACLEAENED